MSSRILFFSSILIFSFLSKSPLMAQGVRGTVRNTAGEVLPNASLFIPEIKASTAANTNGQYAMKLAKGKYTLVISFLGYKSESFQVEVENAWIEHDFSLKEQGFLLSEVNVGKGNGEDFAYAIMRKAIAKRKYHLMQYNSYEMRAYTKGTGEVMKVPFLVRKKLEKEGLKAEEAYTTESVSQIKFTRPNKVEEKVLSVRTKGQNSSPSASPTMFINQSFYNDKIASFVSPLAESSFTHYRFKYLGAFEEGDRTIFKIGITPRSKGDNVFEGTIYILEDYWAVKGLDLASSILGFPVKIRQQYAEVEKSVWLPVTHNYTFSGNIFGFEGEFKYLVSCSNYKVELNKELVYKPVETDRLILIPSEKVNSVPESKEEAAALLAANMPMSRKQYLKILEKYEKESLKEQKDPEVVSERTFSIDKMAGKRDSSYWDTIRPVPLTIKEVKGYVRDDSTAKAEADSTVKKSASKGANKFGLFDIIGGDSYKISKNLRFTLNPTFTQVYYNTVEGLAINLSGSLVHRRDTVGRSWKFEPVVRYGFDSEKFYGKGRLTTTQRKGLSSSSLFFEGGEFIEQFNADDPIHPLINSVSTLFYRRNFMKLYEKQYALSGYEYRPSAFFKLNASVEWAQRNELFNNADYSFFFKDKREFTPNAPINIELPSTSFNQNQSLSFAAGFTYRPIQRYRISNGRKIALTDQSPEITFAYKKGIRSVLGSDVDYDFVQAGISHSLPVGAGDRLIFEFKGGTYLNNKSVYFMDYRHFDANQTSLTSIKPAGSYRLLDYYIYSTNNSFLSAHMHYGFRKFLLTRIPEARYMGLKENVFVNYLKTPESPHYYELGYSLDNILRIFRVEVVAAFTDSDYQESGFRVGIATMFKFNSK